jgi:hypothetical protein
MRVSIEPLPNRSLSDSKTIPTGLVVVFQMFLLPAVAPVAAQQATGEPGSPSATTTIDGKQLPPPPTKFGGVTKPSAADSKPWWPPRVVPPKGAPNVLLIMTDDEGYGVSGTIPPLGHRHTRLVKTLFLTQSMLLGTCPITRLTRI